jgi:hypothetical protein
MGRGVKSRLWYMPFARAAAVDVSWDGWTVTGRNGFLTRQVPPSRDISCTTAINDPDNDGFEMTDPRRKVYGIRPVKRSR